MSPYFVATTRAGVGGPDSGTAAGGGGSVCASGGAEAAVGEVPWALGGGAADGAAMGSSKFQVSTMHFQVPSACFLQISRRRPRSDIGASRESPRRSS